ncbi:MAG: hypothetical protein AUJ49_02920 [Desulfovibrionaceae bacterium CG1_02_65_16]|nr:MAG: hypothetical protein AUJ49_02920 [Desulfovibrionaceae bacterium CG1_02_65_16]
MRKPTQRRPSMEASAPQQPDGRRAILLALLAAVLLMAGCVFGMWRLRQDTLTDEDAGQRRLSITLAEQTALAFREIDLILRETRQSLDTDTAFRQDDRLHRQLAERFQNLQQGQALMVFGPDGAMLGHSREFPTPRVNISDRDYFQAQRPLGDELFISRPLRNRVNGRWMISLSRRISGQDGRFAGVVMAAVEMEYFSRLYRSLNLPPGTLLTLRRRDGVVLTSSPFDENRLGRTDTSDAGPGGLVAESPVPFLPLIVRLSLPRSAALRSWRLHMLAAGAGMLAILAAVAAFTAARRAHVRELRRRTELLQQSEQALRESETRHRTIVETANEGICVFNAQGRIAYANRVMAELLGCSEAELLGRPLSDILSAPASQRRSGGEQGAPVETGDADWLFKPGRRELKLAGKNGAEVWAIASTAPLGDDPAAPGGAFAMFTDITARKEQERFREGIEGILRHDLRSPLTSMSYIPQVLLTQGELNEQQRWSVKELDRYVRRMLRMVDAYLKLSSMERDSFELEARPVDVSALLAEAQNELSPLIKAGSKRVAVTRAGAAAPAEEPFVVAGEEPLVQTLLVNLVKNALEAAPDGSAVEVDLGGDDTRAVIAVRNLGAVPPAIRARFFQKYVTAGKSRGTGLGAYSARMIAQALGGAINLDASDPKATTIRVTLPRPAAQA